MKIAYLHYHLKTGGVASVMMRQIMALGQSGEALVLTGEPTATPWPCKVIVIPELGYQRPGSAPLHVDRVAQRVITVLADHWDGGCDLLHVHNPTLGKNRQWLGILDRLQAFGLRLFLQIHDFAEDGRPHLYVEAEYPADCHYGVINRRDAGILAAAGLTATGIHHLPNPVESLVPHGGRRPRPRVLYPVRAIRRKNLGEAILLSLFFDDRDRLAITQPPNSPADVASYLDWLGWIKENGLPVDVQVGADNDFATLVADSKTVVTTSISEGFGLVFLEPWTAGKLLWGRRIDTICRDYEAKGIRLEGFYDRLVVPMAWIDARAFGRDWHAAIEDACNSYGHAPMADAIAAAYARITRGEVTDFGLLNEHHQCRVLARLVAGRSAKAELVSLNPWLARPGRLPDPVATIDHNRQAVLAHYGMARYRRRLLRVYERVMGPAVEQRIDKAALCAAFFDLDRFSLLKWGAYVDQTSPV